MRCTAFLDGRIMSRSDLLFCLSNRSISHSSANSGILAPETADQITSATSQQFFGLDKHSDEGLTNPNSQFVGLRECDLLAQEVILAYSTSPGCCFDNFVSMAPNNVRQYISDMSACKQHADPESVRSLLWQRDDMLVAAWCVTHDRVPYSPFGHTHTAGNTCTDHSSFGKRCGMAGPHTMIFYIWSAAIQQVRPRVINAENMTHIRFCTPTSASLETSMLVIELLSRRLSRAGPQREYGSSSSCFTSHVSALCWQRLACFGTFARKPVFLCNQCCARLRGNAITPGGRIWWQTKQSWREELAWAMNRPDVKKRHAEGHGGFHDELGSLLYAFNTTERKRTGEISRKLASFCVVDAERNVDQRAVHSTEGKLNTIVAQAGLMFLPELDVWSIGLDGRTRVRELGECEALPRKWFTPRSGH